MYFLYIYLYIFKNIAYFYEKILTKIYFFDKGSLMKLSRNALDVSCTFYLLSFKVVFNIHAFRF